MKVSLTVMTLWALRQFQQCNAFVPSNPSHQRSPLSQPKKMTFSLKSNQHEPHDCYLSTSTSETSNILNNMKKSNKYTDSLNHMGKGMTSSMLVFSLLFNIHLPSITFDPHSPSTIQTLPMVAHAESYGSLSDEQKAVAEAWRIVDNTFIDRTFNHQDWFQMRQDLVKKTKYKNINEARDAISKMVATLGDKYTRYLPPDKYQSLVDSATGTLAGIGVELGYTPGTADESTRVQANDVEEKSPAQIAGIQPLDVFKEVDGKNVERASPDEVAQLARGPVGSKVGVVMERNGKPLDFIVTRDKITVTSVKSYMGKNNVGVVKIKSFNVTTASTVSESLEKLKKKGATSFIIDVRSNPGGLIPGGVDTVGLFLETDTPIVFVVDKYGVVDSQRTYTTGPELDTPIVIFVNDQTASASEVFTAALQENQRAVVVGEGSDHTFGKGIVQTIRELSNGNGGVAVTIARYETPKHNDINKKGITVDMKVDSCTSTDATICLPPSAFKTK